MQTFAQGFLCPGFLPGHEFVGKATKVGLLSVRQDVKLICNVVKISQVSGVKNSGDGKEL